MTKGNYVILVRLDKKLEITGGLLNDLVLEPGVYAYAGSAMNGVEARVRRHYRKGKSRRCTLRLPRGWKST